MNTCPRPLTICLLLGVATIAAAVTLTEEAKDGRTCYRMANERLTMLVDPAAGGGVVSFRDQAGGDVELIPPKGAVGLCLDHFQSQVWPGELLDATYAATVEKQTPDECVLLLTYTTLGSWRGDDNEKIRDLYLEKRYILRAGVPAFECRVRITAPPKAAKLFAYWQQNIFWAGGQFDRGTDKSFRPSTRGVRVKSRDDPGLTGYEDFIRDFTAGWMALLDTERKSGLVVLSQYDELDVAYMCQATVTLEPMYRMTYLPPGESVEYVNWIVPVAGLDNVVTANRDCIAGYRMATDGAGKGDLAIQLVRSVNPPQPLTMDVAIAAAATTPDQAKPVGTLDFPAPTGTPVARTLPFTGVGADPLVVRVDMHGKDDASHHFEEYFNGTFSWGENITVDMSTPLYLGERPPQQLSLKKPAKIALRDLPGDQIWFVTGLLDDGYKCAPAVNIMSRWAPQVKTVRDQSFLSYTGNFKTRLDSFPYDYEKLFGYDLIILGGVKREALGMVGMEMLTDYCRAGGGLLVLGGPNAYGASHLAGTALTDRWPVEFDEDPFGLVRLDDAPLAPGPGTTAVPVLAGIDFAAQPRVQYVHKVRLKPGAQVVLQAGGMPFMVFIEHENGQRIACILGAAMGTMHPGNTAFWEWPEWTSVMQQTGWWLTHQNRDRHFRRDPDAAELE